jgi:hypothetical protein
MQLHTIIDRLCKISKFLSFNEKRAKRPIEKKILLAEAGGDASSCSQAS